MQQIKNQLLYLLLGSASLRLCTFATMTYLGNSLHKVDFSTIASVYVLCAALSQIISYACSTLVFESSYLDARDKSRTYSEKQERAAVLCLRWWIALTTIIVVGLALAKEFLIALLFASKIGTFDFYVGLLWMCGMSLEAVAINLSIKSAKMYQLFLGGFLQLTLLIALTPISILFFGVKGIVAVALVSYVCGVFVILRTTEIKLIFKRPGHSDKSIFSDKLLWSILPSAIAVLSAASLNSILLGFVIRTPYSVESIGTFTLAMQLFSFFSFLPQTSVNFAASKLEHRPTGRSWKLIEAVWFISITSLAVALVCTLIGPKIALFIYPNYTMKIELFWNISLMLLTASLGQLFAHAYVLTNRQSIVAIASAIALLVSVTQFVLSGRVDSSSMLLAVVIYNLVRIIIFLSGFRKITR